MHYKYVPKLQLGVTTDVVMLRVIDGKLQILLLQRDEDPFKGLWSLPGGFVESSKTFEETIRNKIVEKTGYSDMYLEQLYSFDSIDRDPRGRIVSIAYIGLLGDKNTYNFSSDGGNKETKWVDLIPQKEDTLYEQKYSFILKDSKNDNIELAFDHQEIITTAIERIVNKIWYSPIIYKLLPEEFTLLDAKNIFEIFLCRKVNNFHRRVKGVLAETGNIKSGQAYRPAKMFKLKEE